MLCWLVKLIFWACFIAIWQVLKQQWSFNVLSGAAHVSRFLSMDPGSVAAAQARGAGDPQDAMMKDANTLREHIVRK